jgi:hypothetical protein
MRRIATLVFLLLAATQAMAQDAAAPEPDRTAIRVLALGDAIGGGFGAGLSRVSETSGDYDVSVRFNEESGLARPEVYDWAATTTKILDSSAYDVIVVMLGTNDTQPIRQGDQRIAFNTPEWTVAYGTQVDRLLAALNAANARIIWVGPPPMRDPEYDAAMKTIAAIQRERVEAAGFTFIDLRPALSGPDGEFTETGPDDTGVVTYVRAWDGISFYKPGNNRIGQILLAAIESGGAPIEASTRQDLQHADDIGPQVPVFGQALMDGEAYTVQPEGVTANAVMLAAAGLESQAALKALRDIAPKGSGAERLFRRGEAPPAPAGRADDFMSPPTQ